ncbi:hypothetical protein AOG1_27010 [Geobacter sp. AOG1]|nr:hypothetical protein AOG1_27010 [Geobacter sp. AOG1]
MTRRLPLLILGYLLLAAPLHAQDDMEDKIRLLEQQIQELKTLRAQQAVGKQKADQCLKAVGREKFCNCIGENLPTAVSFEQYIHTRLPQKKNLVTAPCCPSRKNWSTPPWKLVKSASKKVSSNSMVLV